MVAGTRVWLGLGYDPSEVHSETLLVDKKVQTARSLKFQDTDVRSKWITMENRVRSNWVELKLCKKLSPHSSPYNFTANSKLETPR